MSIESGADADLVGAPELLDAVRRQQREGQRPYYRIVVAVEAPLRRLGARARPEPERREVARDGVGERRGAALVEGVGGGLRCVLVSMAATASTR